MPQAQVRRYDYQARRYTGEDTTFLYGADLLPVLEERYHRTDSRAHVAYLREQGITLPDVYRTLDFDPRRLPGTSVRTIMTDDRLKPWFGPTLLEGFEMGLATTQGMWEPLIGQVIPLTQATTDSYGLVDPEGDDNYTLRTVAQGSPIPVAKITIGGKGIRTEKQGRGLQLTYEAQRAPISLVQVWLRVLTMRLGRSKLSAAVGSLLNGWQDDNSDDPVIVLNAATDGTVTMIDLMTAADQLEFVHGYPVTDLVLSNLDLIGLLNLTRAVSGELVFPNGVESIKQLLRIQNDIHPVAGLTRGLYGFMNRDIALIRYEVEAFGTEEKRDPENQTVATFGTMEDLIAPGVDKGRVWLDARPR